MVQSRAGSPEDIYDTLTDDTEFMSYVGEYTFVSQQEAVDSITILTPGAKIPQLKSQSGLEVIIHDSGQIRRKDYLTNESEALVTWQVFLIAWPGSDGTTMTNAAKRLIKIFAGATALPVIATPNELGALVQTLISIPDNAAILI